MRLLAPVTRTSFFHYKGDCSCFGWANAGPDPPLAWSYEQRRRPGMHEIVNPPELLPAASYSHGIKVAAGARWLAIAGQVGRDQSGAIPEGIEAQAELAWRNVDAVLRAAGMTMGDLVEINVFLIRREDNAGFDAVRTKWLVGAKPASTKLFVAGLADPRMLCEVRALAASA
jgi:2-iminobutanoate/2-iminopropanoate deaminase